MADQHTSFLLRLPCELREQIFSYIFEERIEGKLRPNQSSRVRPRPSLDYAFFEKPKAYLRASSNKDLGVHFALFSTLPIAQASRELREEVSYFLRTAPIDVVTTIHHLDYDHVISYFETLPPAKLLDFAIRPDGCPTRQLRITFAGAPDTTSLANLERWLVFLSSHLSPHEEMATANRIHPDSSTTMAWGRSAPLTLVRDLYLRHKHEASRGLTKEELWKVFCTYWGRYRADLLMYLGADFLYRVEILEIPIERYPTDWSLDLVSKI